MRFFSLLTALVFLSSCNLIDKGTTYDDERNPFIKQADEAVAATKYEDALAAYEEALQANPKLASVHEALGYIYANNVKDPVSSIFHFRRYLAMQPDSPKASEIKDLIEKEGQEYSLTVSSPNNQAADDLAKLQSSMGEMRSQLETTTQKLVESQQQIIDLKQQVIDLKNVPTPTPPPTYIASAPVPQQQVRRYVPAATPPPMPSVEPGVIVNQSTNSVAIQAVPVNPVATPVDPTAPVSTSPQGASRTYKVVQGDSLWKIAHKEYPHDTKNGVDKLTEANKDTIGGKPLKIGMVLVVP